MSEEKSADQSVDQELNDLLDSALKDFSKEPPTEPKDAPKPNTTVNTAEPKELTSDNNAVESPDDAWIKDFIKQAADEIEGQIQDLLQNGGDGDLEAPFQRLAQTVAEAATNENGLDADNVASDFQAAVARAVNDLSTMSENLQMDSNLMEMFGQTSMDDTVTLMLPYVRKMLKHLLSQDTLYSPLKQVIDKYPQWMEEKKATLTPEDIERFTKQLELIKKVCTEIEKVKDDDSEEIEKDRIETLISLTEELQSHGTLPEELIKDLLVYVQGDGENDLILPASLCGMDSPQNCCLM